MRVFFFFTGSKYLTTMTCRVPCHHHPLPTAADEDAATSCHVSTYQQEVRTTQRRQCGTTTATTAHDDDIHDVVQALDYDDDVADVPRRHWFYRATATNDAGTNTTTTNENHHNDNKRHSTNNGAPTRRGATTRRPTMKFVMVCFSFPSIFFCANDHLQIDYTYGRRRPTTMTIYTTRQAADNDDVADVSLVLSHNGMFLFYYIFFSLGFFITQFSVYSSCIM